jgi:hypothetical protein
MIDTSFGKVSPRSPWLNTKDWSVRGGLKDEIIFQTDTENGILRRKPRVNQKRESYTYQGGN